jgi:prepilin-type N-terminal cleavage/methylation domain-containing protein
MKQPKIQQKIKKQGFTLIELLVVVLIIGILAAIALPHYTVVVERSRISEAVMVSKNIENRLRGLLGRDAAITQAELNRISLNKGEWVGDEYQTDLFSYGPFSCDGHETCTFAFNTLPAGKYGGVVVVGRASTERNCYSFGSNVGYKVCQSIEPSGWVAIDGNPS